MPDDRAIARVLLDRCPRSFGGQVGANLTRAGPTDLFRLLTGALLASARISGDIAVAATRALADAGWTTARKMAAADWAERTRVLNESGYARYDERTSAMLGETSDLLLDRYGGDLRRLRDEAGREPAAERRLLKACKGVGDVGVDIFFREAQLAWDELHPFVDARARRAADRLDLPADDETLASLVSRPDLPRLLTALVDVDRRKTYDEVRAAT